MKEKVPERIACDVLVAGGGASGTVAALASARAGAQTVLVEQQGVLGGVGVSGFLRHLCGLYMNGKELPKETLNKGIVEEIVQWLMERSLQQSVMRIGKVYVLPFSGVHLQHVLHSLCLNEKNLKVILNASTDTVSCSNQMIEEFAVSVSGKKLRIFPRVLIDCTGNGEAAFMAGASFNLSTDEERQLAGYFVRLKGIHEQDEVLPIKVPYYLSEAVTKKHLPSSFRFTHYSPGDLPDEGYLKFSIQGLPGVGRESQAKENVSKAMQYLADRLPCFSDCTITETSAGVIDREGRRICGEYTLTEEDVLEARKFNDGVVKNAWPIEIWDKDKGPVYRYVKANDFYEIPLRCLKARDVRNLFCAGRCISVTHEALGSTRVMGTCMALGEQAGRAAAFMARNEGVQKTGDKRDRTDSRSFI